jgi:hypothetical protein
MTTSTTLPWFPFTFNFPSGDVDLGGIFSPNISVSYAGNPAIERDVVENVASFGKQLGVISEALLEIAEGDPGEKIGRLKEMVADIEDVKERRKRDMKRDAEAAIERLAKLDEPALKALLRRYAA